jgi:hypothetical protein
MDIQIHLIGDSSQWWLADWLVYGQARFPDRYKQAVAETLLEYRTLRNYAVVARRVDMSRRRDKLSFQHHAEVAALPEPDQDLWLNRAERLGWSLSELRRQLRNARSSAVEGQSARGRGTVSQGGHRGATRRSANRHRRDTPTLCSSRKKALAGRR